MRPTKGTSMSKSETRALRDALFAWEILLLWRYRRAWLDSAALRARHAEAVKRPR
jgi:hypothetical protein